MLACFSIFFLLRLLTLSSMLQATASALLLAASVSPAVLGFAMTYILQLPQLFAILVRYRVALESDIVSVERLLGYEDTGRDEEADDTDGIVNTGAEWPSHSQICFDAFSARHRDGLPLCLHNITLTIHPGERVGVIGRTGSGKTSLAWSLLRIIVATAGHIRIDGIDISTVPLQTLRTRVHVIPQECAVFRGTLCYNLDPLGEHSDEELRRVLHDTFLDSVGEGMRRRMRTKQYKRKKKGLLYLANFKPFLWIFDRLI